jgi:helicase
MIECSGEEIEPTRLGALVSKLYIDPLSAVIMIENLTRQKKPLEKKLFEKKPPEKNESEKKPSDLRLIHLITMTPNMDLLYVQAADRWIEEFIDEHEDDLNPEENYDFLLREAKTSAMLMDWIGEVKEEQVSDRYRIGPGDIRRTAETAEWLMHSLSELSKHLNLGLTFKAEQLSQRIHYGAGPDLLALLDLKGVGRVRARKLYLAGYTSLEKLRAASAEEIARLIGPKIAEKVAAQLKKGEML